MGPRGGAALALFHPLGGGLNMRKFLPALLHPFELRGEFAHLWEGSHVTVRLNLIPETEVR